MLRSRLLKKALFLSCIFTLAVILTVPAIMGNGVKKLNLSYVYFGSPSSYTSYVDSTNGSLTGIFPDYFNLTAEGNLKLTSKIDSSFIKQMHDRGIKVIPFVSNHWDRAVGRNALQNRQTLVQEIANAVKTYNLDGVNVDIEGMNENDRANYIDFIRILRGKIPSNKTISVAVAANPYETSKGWHGSYDYGALAGYCDYIIVMAYDEHYEGSVPGPVASSSFVERSIQYALKNVPKDKILLGIPFYGRYWKYGEGFGGYGANISTIDKLIKKYNGDVTFDKASQSAKAVITIPNGTEYPVVGNKKLTAGRYTFWYEDESSIKHKLKLVQKYDLGGTATWSLSQETESTWDYYDMWLNGHYFIDIENHWAQDSILSVEQKGWMIGTSSAKFSPGTPLTRAQAAVILVRSLGLEDEIADSDFTDISKHWAKKEIEIAYDHGIVEGKSSSIFAPDEPITREQMAAMLDRILTNLQPVEDSYNFPFEDIRANDWSYDSVEKMTYHNIFNGYSDGAFHPKDMLDRAQMATLMGNVSEYIG